MKTSHAIFGTTFLVLSISIGACTTSGDKVGSDSPASETLEISKNDEPHVTKTESNTSETGNQDEALTNNPQNVNTTQEHLGWDEYVMCYSELDTAEKESLQAMETNPPKSGEDATANSDNKTDSIQKDDSVTSIEQREIEKQEEGKTKSVKEIERNPDIQSKPVDVSDSPDRDKKIAYFVNVPLLNVRKGPSMKSEIIRMAKKGTIINGLSREGIWIRTETNEYVSILFLKEK
ncbi:MAG: SH3 domain-containing protein [Oligoflexales bacterium]|nr:SH3 domain-containing protein [Oligoflexales bacterium]